MMFRAASRKFAAAALMCCVLTPAARADVRVRWRDTDTPAYEVTLYLKGSAQRREFRPTAPGGHTWAYVDDCARRQFVWLDLVNRRYTSFSGGVPVAAVAAFNEQQFAPPTYPGARGSITEVVTVTDTGERREMFGFTARRLKTLATWRVEPDACDAGVARIETDGWYVDLLHGIDCSPDLSGAMPRAFLDFAGSKCLNKRLATRKYFFRRQYEGRARPGFPVMETTRTYGERGGVRVRTYEVTELSTDGLDAALFAVPDGYTRVEPGPRRKGSAFSRALSIFRRD